MQGEPPLVACESFETRRAGRRQQSAVFVLALILPLCTVFEVRRSQADQQPVNLQLEVFINGVPAHMISSFMQFSGGKIGAQESELEELGLRTGLNRSAGDLVLLDEIHTLKYEYIERLQQILITVSDEYRITRVFDLNQNSPAKAPAVQTGWGTVLNYDFLGATGNVQPSYPIWYGGISFTLDARAFSPYGTFEQSALVLSNQYLSTQIVRLDSSYRYSDQSRLISYGAGDAISGGLAWTRPIRFGGGQVQSNFAMRPDLVTMPLPTLGGTAAVPSTVDVYVNNVKTFSQDVNAGPFSIANIPLVTGAGNAQLVIRDASGQETRTILPFYASASLLAPGLSSWSIEAGAPRLAYGTAADTYVKTPIASATFRHGIFDWLTLEGHAEGGAGLANGGLGAAVRTGTFGVAEASFAGSTFSGSNGLQGYFSYDTNLLGLNVHASWQHTFGVYNDLASATARLQYSVSHSSPYLWGFLNFLPYVQPEQFGALYSSALPLREIDQISTGRFDPV
jgi:outer membrane usher protein